MKAQRMVGDQLLNAKLYASILLTRKSPVLSKLQRKGTSSGFPTLLYQASCCMKKQLLLPAKHQLFFLRHFSGKEHLVLIY